MLEVDYEYQAKGTYTHEDYSGDPRKSITESVLELASVHGCEQEAKVIIDEASEPRWETDIRLPPSIGVELIEALDLEIPGDAMSVYELQQTQEGISLRLGNCGRTRDMVDQIRETLSVASDRV